MRTLKTQGNLYGVNWERHPWGTLCYGIAPGGTFMESRKYVGNGSEGWTIRAAVLAFRRDVWGIENV